MKLFKVTNCLALAAVMAFASVAQAQQVELGGNLSFEDPVAPDSLGINNFGTFQANSSSAGTDTIAPLSGASHAFITIAGDANSFSGIQQDVTAIEGESYTFGFNARTDGNDYGIVNEFRLEFIGTDAATGNAVEVGREQLTDSFADADPTVYSPFSVTGVAPVGAETVRAVIALQSFGTATNFGTAFIDDASITGPAAAAAVPEPSSLTLVALGALGLVSRRRRS